MLSSRLIADKLTLSEQEQAESQAVPNKEEEEAEKLKEDEVAMDVCEEETEKEEVDELESSEGQKVKDMKKAHPRDQNEEEREEVQNQVRFRKKNPCLFTLAY